MLSNTISFLNLPEDVIQFLQSRVDSVHKKMPHLSLPVVTIEVLDHYFKKAGDTLTESAKSKIIGHYAWEEAKSKQ